MSFLENCRRLIGFDSTPGHGTLQVGEFVRDLCADAKMTSVLQRETLDGVDQCNVIARSSEARPRQEIMFQAPLDTADAGHFAHWTKTQSNPFNASIYNDTIYGLGTTGSKLDFLCKLEAARDFVGQPMRRPFVLVGTFAAYHGMAGAIKLIRRKQISASMAVLAGATQMRLVHAGLGIATIEISIPFSSEEQIYRRDHDLIESASSQSRMFTTAPAEQDGESAIMKMFDYVSRLPEGMALLDLNGGTSHLAPPATAVLEIDTVAGFRDPILPKISYLYSQIRQLADEVHQFRDEEFQPPHPSINLGMIRTFDTEVQITGGVKLPPAVTDVIYEGWMRKFAEAVKGVGATFRVRDYRKGFATALTSELLHGSQEAISDLGLDNAVDKGAWTSEASVFCRHGIDCVVWGPGQGRSGMANESVQLSDLQVAIDYYKRLIERFCL